MKSISNLPYHQFYAFCIHLRWNHQRKGFVCHSSKLSFSLLFQRQLSLEKTIVISVIGAPYHLNMKTLKNDKTENDSEITLSNKKFGSIIEKFK